MNFLATYSSTAVESIINPFISAYYFSLYFVIRLFFICLVARMP